MIKKIIITIIKIPIKFFLYFAVFIWIIVYHFNKITDKFVNSSSKFVYDIMQEVLNDMERIAQYLPDTKEKQNSKKKK